MGCAEFNVPLQHKTTGWMDVFPDFTCRIIPYSCSSIPSLMSTVLSLAVTLSTRSPGETLPSLVPLASIGSTAFSTAKVLRISRDAFVSSPLPVWLDFGLLVSAGKGLGGLSAPSPCSCVCCLRLTLGLPGWVRNFPLELESFQNGQQDTHRSNRLPF